MRAGSPSATKVTKELRAELAGHADPGRADVMKRFFKTGKGQYGQGDVFIGVAVPASRRVARKYSPRMSLGDVLALLRSKVHEERLVALLVLVQKFDDEPGAAAALFLDNLEHVNSWDLVDLAAPRILGAHLKDESDRSILYRLALSEKLWERRVAMMATQAFIRAGEYKDALAIAETLLGDPHDLIHKAAGWMLREVGNRDIRVEEAFLRRHGARMPRTMLRYAIEKFPEAKRRAYLGGGRRLACRPANRRIGLAGKVKRKRR